MLYEQPAVLEYLRPHKPLVRASTTNITNNTHYMVNNNLRFNFTIHMKNMMPLSAAIPLVRNGSGETNEHYTQIPLERYILDVSEYEWFLHTSRLKEVYRRQKQFIRTMERRQSGHKSFIKIIENDPNLAVHAPLSWNADRMTPTIYYVTTKSSAQPPSAEALSTVTNETVTQNTAREYTGAPVTVENKTIVNNVDINAVAARVTKTISEKLNLERLKKGR